MAPVKDGRPRKPPQRPPTGHSSAVVDEALWHLDNGRRVVPVLYKSKNPGSKGWEQLRLDRDDLVGRFRVAPQNYGVLLGEPSGGTVDVDLDCPQARSAAQVYLPETDLVYGRAGNPASHRYYVCRPAPATKQYRDTDGTMLVELRSTGAQSVAPPSVHPSGEAYVYESRGDPVEVAPGDLLPAVGTVAATAILARHWPAKGGRHNAALALAGALLRAGWLAAAVATFVRAVAEAANDEEVDDRVRAVATTAAALRADDPATGWPTLHGLLTGDGRKVCDKVREWLGVAAADNSSLPAAPAQPDDWPEPAPLTQAAAAPFPVAVLPPALREQVQAVAEAMPCPVDIPAGAGLAACSMAVGVTRGLRVKDGWTTFPCLYLASVADVSTKKTPAANAMLDPVYARNGVLNDEYKRALRDFKKAGGEAERPPLRQAFAGNLTVEALIRLLRDNPRGLGCVNDELTAWVQGMNAYRPGADRQFWLSCWSNSAYQYNRATTTGGGPESIFLSRPFVSVYGNLPPDSLLKLTDRASGEDGLLERILFTYPSTRAAAWADAGVPREVESAYADLVGKLYALDFAAGEPVVVGFTAEAKDTFVTFVTDTAAERDGADIAAHLRGAWGKMEGQCARLALLLHQIRTAGGSPTDVDRAAVDGAVALCDYFKGTARRAHAHLLTANSSAQGRDAEAVVAWVRKAQCVAKCVASGDAPSFKWREVRHDLHARFENRDDDLRKVLALLEGRGYLREVEQQRQGATGRNPKPSYLVNPRWLHGRAGETSARSVETP
jgi:hypothetical protein